MMKALVRYCVVLVSLVQLAGCAVGHVLMAGYTPPKTIQDVLIEQGKLTNDTLVDADTLNESENTDDDIVITLEKYRPDSRDQQMASSTVRLPEYDGQHSDAQGWVVDSSQFNPTFTHKSLDDYARQLAITLFEHSRDIYVDDFIGVASFVQFDQSLTTSNVLGNQLAEYFITELQQLGFAVVDFKTTGAIQVTQTGDYVFSRDMMSLASQMQMDHVLSGTLIERPTGVKVSARIISVANKQVVASALIDIPHFITQNLYPN